VHRFAAAIEARNIDAVLALLADDVALRSPIAFKPYQGRRAVAVILRAVSQVLDDFRYVRHIGAPGAEDTALVFPARVGEHQIEGSDFLHLNQDGAIDELTVMVRPLSAARALADAVAAQLDAVRDTGGT